ncbi:hypothetical protein EDB80DRAFT_693344 [Ilyonectria destructans]|nr:hypothetical protein EDB80DRAFT_693344 [Ilyonectria destructans]
MRCARTRNGSLDTHSSSMTDSVTNYWRCAIFGCRRKAGGQERALHLTSSLDQAAVEAVAGLLTAVESDNGPEVVEDVAKFLWRSGFSFTNYPVSWNWKDGVLVDSSEIVHADGDGWNGKLYGPREARWLLGSGHSIAA